MKTELTHNTDYAAWLAEIKLKIQRTQAKAALAANSEIIWFYFDLGKSIVTKQADSNWGDNVIGQLARDLKNEFPGIGGFSLTNLKYCQHFYTFYAAQFGQQGADQNYRTLISQQGVDQIPWGHNILIFTKSKNAEEASFYIAETIKNGWNRDVLALQIKSGAYARQGKAITNFKATLPENQFRLAQQTIKDPYFFDFISLSKPYAERDIENQLTSNITKFLLELGKGFAFLGRQYHLQVSETDYYIDLLFYHVILKAYVVIELKNSKFMPEFAGKLNFYLSAVDTLVKQPTDNPTIGILLCRDKNNLEVEFALRDMNKPMGVSEFCFTEVIPENLKASLPSIEEFEMGLKLDQHD